MLASCGPESSTRRSIPLKIASSVGRLESNAGRKRDRHAVHPIDGPRRVDPVSCGAEYDRAARVVGVSLGSRTIEGIRARCSRAACEKLDIGSLAMISAASASPRPSVSAVVYSPGLKRG